MISHGVIHREEPSQPAKQEPLITRGPTAAVAILSCALTKTSIEYLCLIDRLKTDRPRHDNAPGGEAGPERNGLSDTHSTRLDRFDPRAQRDRPTTDSDAAQK